MKKHDKAVPIVSPDMGSALPSEKMPPRHSAAMTSPWRGLPLPAEPDLRMLGDFEFLESPMFQRSIRIGEALAGFEAIIEPTPQQMSAAMQMNSLRLMGLRQPEGQMRRGGRYIQPSGTGKSTCGKILQQHIAKQYDYDPDRKTILHVTLSTTGTPKSLASSILSTVGDNYSTRGEAELLLKRVREVIRDFNVELIIIDELNHIKGKSLSTDAANTIKNILTLGWAPVVLMGTSAAENIVSSNRELKMRCQPQKFLRPYVAGNDTDDRHWRKLLGSIDQQMEKRGIVTRQTGLKEISVELCRASNGRIGEFHGIMMSALEAALTEGEDYVSHDHLAAAIDEWAINDGTIEENPLLIQHQPENVTPNGDFSDEEGEG